MYPIPQSILERNPDGSVKEYLYYVTSKDFERQPWLLTLRDFASYQKRIYGLEHVQAKNSRLPLWCSWTDWYSDHVTDKVILNSVKKGVSCGIRNFIIDDGWFGPGLDHDYTIELNIGDWEPDPKKIQNMSKLVKQIKEAGGNPLIWCAPHAVAKGAKCFKDRRKYLIEDGKGNLLLTPNKFHSLCFMSPEAREIMASICLSFITRWDFSGAKYDLFNCIPPQTKCNSKSHEHNVSSMIEGLGKTLELIYKRCCNQKKDYIVELKQNYGTPFFTRWGTMIRAGDTPYDSEGNFLRTLYNQSYSINSLNDYQTITNEDTPEEAACIIIKMMAAGIPAYSIDFERLNLANTHVISNYNKWYINNLKKFGSFRIPLNGENTVIMLPHCADDIYFVINNGGNFTISKDAIILNGTFQQELFISFQSKQNADISLYNCYGTKIEETEICLDGWARIKSIPGGITRIAFSS
jgi:hypothetical protein